MSGKTADKVLQAVREAAGDGPMTCTQAHRLAAELQVPLAVIGRAADELKIKIRECQLGCFR
ncbi:MAG: hypothetical protein ACOX8W_11115 [bacterium]|jgi:hypothetical protein